MVELRVRRPLTGVAAALLLAGAVGTAAGQESEDARRERDRVRAPRVTVNGRGMTFYSNRGRLGVSVTSSPEGRDYGGALVTAVTGDSPAEEAGIREGDVITAINGQRLVDPLSDRSAERNLDLDRSVPVQRLVELLQDVEPGDEVEVTYERDGVETTATVVAERLGDEYVFRGPGSGRWEAGPRDFSWNFDDFEEMRFDPDELRIEVAPRIEMPGMVSVWGFSGFGASGLEMAALNPELGSYFGAEEGVLILDIDEDSPLGLEPGDVLLDIDGREVRDRDHARRILGSYEPGEAVSFGVIRKGSQQTVDGRLPERNDWRRRNRLRN